MIPASLLAVIVVVSQLAFSASSAKVLDSRPDIRTGSWALGFMEGESCEVCASVLAWIDGVQRVFPEFRYVLSYPSAIPANACEDVSGVGFYTDDGAVFGRSLGVEEVPTILIFSTGRLLARVDWPFAEADLLRAMAMASMLSERLVTPFSLLGRSAPAFTAVDLDGAAVSTEQLGFPLLLMFLSPECPSCWGALDELVALPPEVQIAVLLIADSEGLALAQEVRAREVASTHPDMSWLVIQDLETLTMFGVVRSPTYFAIDSQGVIRSAHEGIASQADIDLMIDGFLSDRSWPQ